MNTNLETQLVPSHINPSLYMEAIRIGQQVLLEQGSKASAAMEIFKILKDESREVVLQAFIEGANITPKGSPTYFYNVTRKLRKKKWLFEPDQSVGITGRVSLKNTEKSGSLSLGIHGFLAF